ncbi:rhamnosyl/mannosyltransferase [Haladaptatus litoreus]|uniref:Rhamnosyl/mannosyltransferase n=1 Tax=Haladaptatus litoreus TaxID=553468 RepID=A0A1N7DBZ9_9EURY|nr:glycosyltransferase [Haladaptatus litoreus]SIR73342.1 rhamnosyl/mannosyltransferase [Haladaptatus litoreus]
MSDGSPKVLQVSKFYYPDVGGVERVVQQLAEGLNSLYDMRVLASATEGIGEQTIVNGVPVSRTSSFGTVLSVSASPTFPAQLAWLQRDADIIHYHLPNPLCVGSHFITPKTDAKIVVTYHSDIIRQKSALKFYRPFLRRFLDKADRIMVTSPNLLQSSEHLAPYEHKCTVVPLSINLDDYSDPTGEPPELPVDPDRPTLLFVGRLIYYKGVEYLVDAMTQIDATLLIAGDGELRESLQERAAACGVDNKVHFLGYVPDKHLPHCYEAADLFVLPSVEPSEAFGIVQLEAMAYGTPIINTNLRTGVPWVSKDRETGRTTVPRDSDALANEINEVLDNKELLHEYGENAYQRVQQRFNEETMLDQVNQLYREVLAER